MRVYGIDANGLAYSGLVFPADDVPEGAPRRRRWGAKPRWTDADKAYLLRHAATRSLEDIARDLKRPSNAIRGMLHKLRQAAKKGA